jgi:hypothetical protein
MDVKQKLMDFWYKFDLFFNPGFRQTPPAILQAYGLESSLLPNWLIDRNATNMQNYPTNFADRIKQSPDLIRSIELIAENQLNIINQNLGKDNNQLMQKAFEYFGQGVLFDDSLDEETQLPRRPVGDKVHMMDSLHYGYPRWHVFCRSAVFAGQDQDVWLKLDRVVALAYTLHQKVNPKIDLDGKDPRNPEHTDIVDVLLPVIESAGFDQLDQYFDNDNVRAMFGHL